MSLDLNRQLDAEPEVLVSYQGQIFIAKYFHGAWFFKDLDGEYRRFIAQDKVNGRKPIAGSA